MSDKHGNSITGAPVQAYLHTLQRSVGGSGRSYQTFRTPSRTNRRLSEETLRFFFPIITFIAIYFIPFFMFCQEFSCQITSFSPFITNVSFLPMYFLCFLYIGRDNLIKLLLSNRRYPLSYPTGCL